MALDSAAPVATVPLTEGCLAAGNNTAPPPPPPPQPDIIAKITILNTPYSSPNLFILSPPKALQLQYFKQTTFQDHTIVPNNFSLVNKFLYI
jgi:hypothetical protein